MGDPNRTRPTIDRFDLETVALLLLDVHARRQLALPKNRAKGVPPEDAAGLISCARVEVLEALDAVHDGLSTSEILAELGDVAAFVGMAMWRVMKDDEDAEIPFPTSYIRGIYADEIERLRSELDRLTTEHASHAAKLRRERDMAVAGRLGMPEGIYRTVMWALESMPVSETHTCDDRTLALVWVDRARKAVKP